MDCGGCWETFLFLENSKFLILNSFLNPFQLRLRLLFYLLKNSFKGKSSSAFDLIWKQICSTLHLIEFYQDNEFTLRIVRINISWDITEAGITTGLLWKQQSLSYFMFLESGQIKTSCLRERIKNETRWTYLSWRMTLVADAGLLCFKVNIYFLIQIFWSNFSDENFMKRKVSNFCQGGIKNMKKFEQSAKAGAFRTKLWSSQQNTTRSALHKCLTFAFPCC